jgi:hypothetical protein
MDNKKNPYEDRPEISSDMLEFCGSGYTTTNTNTMIYVDEEGMIRYDDEPTDVSIYGRGIYFNSNERFFMRLWLLVSNPFRYLFTGKIRY